MSEANDAARKLAMNVALVTVATVGAGRGAYQVLVEQAKIARKVIPRPTTRPFDGDGLYRPGATEPEPWRPGMDCDVHMMVFGDSLAAGLGAETPGELPGVLVARGLAEESGWDVRLSVKAIVGATSKGLDGQIGAMRIAGGTPDVSLILIGGNDVTARNSIGPAAKRVGEAVGSLVELGSIVVVGTCPDLGIIKPVPQPLRSVLHTLSRRLAVAQGQQVRRAGGVAVSLAETLAPEFHARGESLFSADHFHPNSAGYELAAGLLLPAVCTALGVWDDETAREHEEAAAADAVQATADAADTDTDTEAGTGSESVGEPTDGVEPATVEDEAPGPDQHPRDSVVQRLTRRLTDFARTHEDRGGPRPGPELHNEGAETAADDPAQARHAADTLRRRSRILRKDDSHQNRQ